MKEELKHTIMSVKSDYYNLDGILSLNAIYNMIIGERSNGKSYAVLKHCLEEYFESGKEIAYIRRWEEDIKGKKGFNFMKDMIELDENGENIIMKLSNGEWSSIVYQSRAYYLANYDDGLCKYVKDSKPFCYAFCISGAEHNKSEQFPNIGNIIFEEFLTRRMFLPNEFVEFMNLLSTLIRRREQCRIFMIGNTVNKYCPYFKEMGLNHVKDMKQGTIDLYTYGDSDLSVAVEYCANVSISKPSDKYFAFNNPKLQMITGGSWEIDIYPHIPCKYKYSEILFNYFIEFDDALLHCEVILHEGNLFTFIHKKSTEIQNRDKDLIFTTKYDTRPNIRRNILKPSDNIGKKILTMFKNDKVFYQDNEVGEVVRNYFNVCKSLTQ